MLIKSLQVDLRPESEIFILFIIIIIFLFKSSVINVPITKPYSYWSLLEAWLGELIKHIYFPQIDPGV